MNKDNVGCRIANLITTALAGRGALSYDELHKIVYRECTEISDFHKLGDWLEMPNGATYTLTFKP